MRIRPVLMICFFFLHYANVTQSYLNTPLLPQFTECAVAKARYFGGGSQIPPLSAIWYLNLDVRPVDLPHRGSQELENMQQSRSPDRLPQLLSLLSHLKFLCIIFRHIDKRMRSVDWTAVHCTQLSTINVENLELSDSSALSSLICPNMKILSRIKIPKFFLFDSTWASFYKVLTVLPFESITDVAGIHGRKYLNDCSVYPEANAACYHNLFPLSNQGELRSAFRQ